MARPIQPMNAKIELSIRMEARGEPHDAILEKVFGPDTVTDPVKRNAAESKLYRWRHRPDAKAVWDDEVREVIKKCIPRAVNRISKQIDSEVDWLANKAANDVVNLAKTTSIFQDDDKTVKVQIEGNLPDLGSPDDA